MDLTLFAVTRAVDVIVGEFWSQRKARRTALGKWTNASYVGGVFKNVANIPLG